MAPELNLRLLPHPSTPPGGVRAITAAVRREPAARLHLHFRLDGEPRHLRLPPPAAGHFALGLWEHTCFEAFIAVEGASGYHELNLSPSGEWAAFAFSAYREIGAVDIETCAPRLAVRVGADGLELEAAVDLSTLSPAYAEAPLRLGLSAVVEDAGGALSYWSLVHLPGKPDFHDQETRRIRLSVPSDGDR